VRASCPRERDAHTTVPHFNPDRLLGNAKQNLDLVGNAHPTDTTQMISGIKPHCYTYKACEYKCKKLGIFSASTDAHIKLEK